MNDLQSQVLKACSRVPRGKVTTYKEIARAIGRPRAWRAVANALAGNPTPIKIPCHRVVRSDGGMGGYTTSAGSPKAGIKRKIELLSAEGVKVEGQRVDLPRFMFKL